jgi:hypothetical protein
MASIFLETMDETAGEPTRHVVDAPATVGRGAECDLRLDPANRALSRIHLEVVAEDGGLYVVNRASNPGTTRHDGRSLVQGDRIALPATGALTFALFGTEVRVGRAGALSVAVSRSPDGEPVEDLGRYDLVPGSAVLVRAGPPATVTTIAPAAWAPPPAGAVPEAQLAVYLDRGQPTLAVLGRADGPVTIDGAELPTASAYLRPLESVAHGGLKLELHEEGLDFRRCPTCATLNPPGRAACRICGVPFAAEPAEPAPASTPAVATPASAPAGAGPAATPGAPALASAPATPPASADRPEPPAVAALDPAPEPAPAPDNVPEKDRAAPDRVPDAP